ncbi:MAG: MFS transporter [Alphaproteobacteria bacterium]|nr:MFS transporter [Alphaproteobacteria bacterium]
MSSPTGIAAIVSAFSNRNFALYASTNILSHFGSWIQRVAMGWLAWELEKSFYWLGVVAVAELAPSVVLAPFAGAFADRVNRLRGIQGTQSLAMVQAIILAGIAFSGDATIGWLVGLAFARGVIMSFNQPLRFSILPSLVDRKDLSSAIGINSLSFNLARVLGPAVAAFIVAQWDAGTAFAVNAASYFIFITALFFIRLDNPYVPEPRPLKNVPAEIVEGIRYCLQMPGIAPLFVLLSVVAMCGRAYAELLPGFADVVFSSGVDGLGWLHAAIGAGAVLGSIILARRSTVVGLTRTVAWSVLVVGLGLIAFTLTANLWVGMLCVGIIGLGMTFVGVGEQQLLQNAVSGEVRGRVMSLYGMISRGGPAFGAFLMGAAADWIGLQIPVAAGGGCAA